MSKSAPDILIYKFYSVCIENLTCKFSKFLYAVTHGRFKSQRFKSGWRSHHPQPDKFLFFMHETAKFLILFRTESLHAIIKEYIHFSLFQQEETAVNNRAR